MGSDVSLSKAVRANLLSLQNTASMMDKTQNRLATGNKVNSALDNPSNFFTAAALNSRAADMSNLLDSMASGIKVIEAANNGITALTKNLESMQSTLRQARQDKSFQTKSFDVSDSSVIKLGGGQFGDSVSEISLATATKAGKPAELTTASATAYLGPVSSEASATGAGARSVISGLDGFTSGDKFTVAGREVTVSAGTVTADSIVADIETALNAAGSNVAGKYTVNVGEEGSVNEGKIVIETVDTSAAAATVTFGAGTTAATKGQTSFNYSAITSSVSAGGQSIPTGSTFEDFVANLQSKAAEGKYTVHPDSVTKQITLTSTEWGGSPPSVTGIPNASGALTGTKAKSEFTLAGSSGSLTHTQTLNVAGATGSINLTAGMDATAIKDAFLADVNLADKYNINVDSTSLKVTLEAKTAATAAAPTVTSSQVASPASPSFHIAAGGLDLATAATADSNLQTLDGTTLTLSGPGLTSTSFAIDNTKTVADLEAALNANGFTVEATENGLSISRKDGQAFSIAAGGGSANDLGLGNSVVNVSNGTLAKTAGIAGGTPATLIGSGGLDLTSNTVLQDPDNVGLEITLDDGVNTPVSYTFGAASTKNDLENTLSQNGFLVTAKNGGLEVTRPDGTNFTMTITNGTSGMFGFADSSITSDDGIPPAVATTPGVADTAAVDGKVETPAVQGASVATVAAEKNEFTISYDGKTANISIGAVKGGIDSPVNALDIKNWQDATITSVNNQLKNQGIDGVEIKFDDAGKMQFVAKAAEAKTLAVSGDDAVALFGTNGVNIGEAEKSDLQSTKTVDKFVELINRDFAGQVRASNDNGKLRIENLSTQNLDINVDTEGALQSHKVDGNSVRANLSKQFNELRDQLDKLADDSSFNGINLLRGDKLKITFNESGTSSIDIQAKDANGNVRGINASNLGVDSLVAEDLDTDEKIDAFLAKLSSALTELRSQASSFGSNLSSVENRQSFTKNMINTLETGAANLTLADTNEEAANLLALQTRQQLSSSALSMASQQDQAVLQLLR
jgi:flagellin-like hook-associated protein FlgL